ncbi:hypothetical protein OHA72_33500 [Dactylosporangium sp. NBC_01737]|uniref:hypothetical protein n=1 Tax=Dactylosporangium sp. NBC_01737 TaxID=2975959 RepID=UPI002E108CF1|nr:hypothetical protein OHA72_33500 [Dactylosporangium sp. NBC_01737]
MTAPLAAALRRLRWLGDPAGRTTRQGHLLMHEIRLVRMPDSAGRPAGRRAAAG